VKKPSTKTQSIKSTKSATATKSVHAESTASPPVTPTAIAAPPAPPTPSPAPQSFADRVTAAVAAITQAKSLLGLDTSLSTTEIQRSVKFKKGGEQFVPTLADLSVRYGVEVPSRPTADMTASLTKATQLAPAKAAIGELSKMVDDSYFGSRSDTWATATSLYSMLKKGATREPNLASALVPLQEYFASRHPSVAASSPKRSPAKGVDKEQKKVAKRIAKLQGQLAQLQAAMPPAETPQADEPAPSQATVAAPATAPAVTTTGH
jgi:hypothetical protein